MRAVSVLKDLIRTYYRIAQTLESLRQEWVGGVASITQEISEINGAVPSLESIRQEVAEVRTLLGSIRQETTENRHHLTTFCNMVIELQRARLSAQLGQAEVIEQLVTGVAGSTSSARPITAQAPAKELRSQTHTDSAADIELIETSGFFDREWYLQQNPDVREAGFDPLDHFLQSGWREGRDPGPNFGLNDYVAERPETVGAGINPLIHYLRSGNLFQSPRFDIDWRFLRGALTPEEGPTKPMGERRSATTVKAVARQEVRSLNFQGRLPLNILIINYGSYDNNSAIQITGLANTLTDLGHRVVVAAQGDTKRAGDFGAPRFRFVANDMLMERPDILSECFAGTIDGIPHLVHCWTPREAVQQATEPVIRLYQCPYIVHFEDNETAVVDAMRGRASLGGDLPGSMQRFVTGAIGATVIVDALREILPEGLPAHLLEPGVDATVFAPNLSAAGREGLCSALGVPNDARIIVYPGNTHPANINDLFSLYVAIHALNAQGFNVHLIRTGISSFSVRDPRFAELSKNFVTELGFVRRDWLRDILGLSDFFVQPGSPDSFNKYRLPSKIPEMLAMARPLVLPATNIGLLLQHRANALLMQCGDAEEITDCVKQILTDPDLAQQLGNEGRRFAIEHFNWERTGRRLVEFYRKILSSSSTDQRYFQSAPPK